MKLGFQFSKRELVTSYIVQHFQTYHDGYWTRPFTVQITAALKKILSVRGGPRIHWGHGSVHWDGQYCFRTDDEAQLMYETLAGSHPKEQYRMVKVVATLVEPKAMGEP